MKKLLSILLIPSFCFAQVSSVSSTQMHTPNPFAGYDFLNRKSTYSRTDLNEEGTYLFPPQATAAKILLKNGRSYTGIMAMLNLLDNELLFQDSLGQVYTAITPINFVEFEKTEETKSSTVFKTGFPAVDDFTDNTFYQVLSEGKQTLLKAYKVAYTDRTTIQSSVPIRRYDTKETLYVYSKSGGMKKIGKKKEEILAVLQDKNREVLDYINHHKTNFKSENDITELFTYYNQL